MFNVFFCEFEFNFFVSCFFEKHAKRIFKHDFERKNVCEYVFVVVVNEFDHEQQFYSIILFEIDENAKKLFHDVVHSFDLFIDLKMKNDRQFTFDFQNVTQRIVVFECENEIFVDDD
jgi:hypothetical protein